MSRYIPVSRIEEKLFLSFPMNHCTKGAARLVFYRIEKRMETFAFVSAFGHILIDGVRNSVTQSPWRPAQIGSSAQVSITVILAQRSEMRVGQAHTMPRSKP